MGVTLAIAAVWGMAEATLFFIVPDVYLSFVALRARRIALWACGAAVAGALVGGAVMYAWGARDTGAADRTLVKVPAIDAPMVQRVRERVAAVGLPAVFLGPLTGTPYKVYAVVSGDRGVSLAGFLLISIPARALRFLLVTLLAAYVAHGPLGDWTLRRKRRLAAVIWTLFYLVYFSLAGI